MQNVPHQPLGGSLHIVVHQPEQSHSGRQHDQAFGAFEHRNDSQSETRRHV